MEFKDNTVSNSLPHKNRFFEMNIFRLTTRTKPLISSQDSKKYISLTAFCIALLFGSGTYCGWQFLVSLFEDHRIYYWLCEDRYDAQGCDEQKEAQQFLFTLALSANYFMNPVAALLIDLIGPKFTFAIGGVFVTSGYMLIAISNEFLELYIPGMFLIGAACDFYIYPAFSLLPLFKYRSFVSGCILGFSCVSWWIPGFFQLFSDQFSWSIFQIFAGYAIFVIVPTCILYFLFLPFKNIQVQKVTHITVKKLQSNEKLDHIETASSQDDSTDIMESIKQDEQLLHKEISTDHSTITLGHGGFSSESVSGSSLCEGDYPITQELLSKNSDEAFFYNDQYKSSEEMDSKITKDMKSVEIGLKMPVELKIEESIIYTQQPTSTQQYISNLSLQKISRREAMQNIWLQFINHPIIPVLKSPQHCIMATFWVLSVLRFAFYFSSINEIIQDQYIIILGFFAPLSCLSYPIYGYVVDKIGFYLGIHIINFVNIIMYICAILASIFPQSVFLSWACVILYPISYGPYVFLLSYARRYWSHLPNYFSIIGFDYVLGGLMSFLTTFLYKLVMNQFEGNFIPVYSLITVLSILLFPLFRLLKRLNHANYVEQ